MQHLEFKSDFKTITADVIHDTAQAKHDDGWRYVQILAVNLDDGVDLVYSYMKDGLLENIQVENVERGAHVSSISDIFLEAFVCENEIHDLFNITFDGLVIDFLGNFYRVENEYPMTIISPEKLAEREKQRKIEAAKAAKAAKASKDGNTGDASDVKQTDTGKTDIEEKLSKMDPEKAAKVRAAMEAKAKKAAVAEEASKDLSEDKEGE